MDRLSADQLKMLLKGRGMPVSGTRQQMLKRLELKRGKVEPKAKPKGASNGGKSKVAAGKAKQEGSKPPSRAVAVRRQTKQVKQIKKEVDHLAIIMQQNVTTQQLMAMMAVKMGSKPDHELADAVVKRMKENGASKDDVKQVRMHPVSVVAMSVLSIVGAYFLAHRLDPKWTEDATDHFMIKVVHPVLDRVTEMIAYWRKEGIVYAGSRVWHRLSTWVDDSMAKDSLASKFVPLTAAGVTGIGAMAATGISLPFLGLWTVAAFAAPAVFATENLLNGDEAPEGASAGPDKGASAPDKGASEATEEASAHASASAASAASSPKKEDEDEFDVEVD